MKKKQPYQRARPTSAKLTINSGVFSFSIPSTILYYANKNGFSQGKLLQLYFEEKLGVEDLEKHIKQLLERELKEKGVHEGDRSRGITELAVRKTLETTKDQEEIKTLKEFQKTGEIN